MHKGNDLELCKLLNRELSDKARNISKFWNTPYKTVTTGSIENRFKLKSVEENEANKNTIPTVHPNGYHCMDQRGNSMR